MKTPPSQILLPIFAWTLLGAAAASPPGPGGEAEELFARRIAPLFREKCLACHGEDPSTLKGGFDLRSPESAQKGGDSGKPGFVAGKPEESPLYLAAAREHPDWEPMPPKEAEKLRPEQREWLRAWISAGAPWPSTARQQEIARARQDQWSAQDGVTVQTSGGLSPDWTNRRYRPESLWAYQPLRKAELALRPGEHPVDALLARRLPPGLALAPPADPLTLIRRVTFDLTGLPPSPEEIDAFAEAWKIHAGSAWLALIERLLASPHYGERMAQHWLDVVRYADSAGFANDFERGNAWRYRDYVVRAFNEDKPYDQFIREQIAGDELAPHDPARLVATGFLRMGPWELTAMEVPKIARQRFLDDVTNSVGEAFLAHSLQCARCHDHKFDPIPTRDYYSLQAIFATTQLAERPAPFLPCENTSGFEEASYLQQSRASYLATLRRLDEKSLQAAEAWYAERLSDPAPWRAVLDELRKHPAHRNGELFAAARNRLLQSGLAEDRFPPRMLGWSPEEIGLERIARKGLERLAWELDRYQPYALSVYNGHTPSLTRVISPVRIPADPLKGEREETCILAGGDPFSPGPKVKPGVLSVLSAAQTGPVPDTLAGRRTALAHWLSSPDNPLTTRVVVNRVWLWHFGEPLAGNPNNFGSTGKRPTHPELLDWLASRFVEQGWSFKALHRLLLTSTAYRRSSTHPDPGSLREKDPLGVSYAAFKPRRLSAEELRDAMLSASGELNRTAGGIPNRPEINPEAALQPRQVMGTFAAAWVPNPRPEQRHRRSLYALKLRGLSDPSMEVFNAPAPDFSCERRESSTVTPQVFALFNSQTSHSRALALAARALRESPRPVDALTRCFRLVYGRPPSPAETARCLAHWQEMEPLQARISFAHSAPPLEVRREAVEENTGEKFSFAEKLHAMADFVPDLRPAACDARTRALADVCLALLNSNEFAYVY